MLSVCCKVQILSAEAFDNAECKAMLTNLVLETMPDKYLVAASGMAGMGSANTIQARRCLKDFMYAGDGASDVSEVGSLVASRVALRCTSGAHSPAYFGRTI